MGSGEESKEGGSGGKHGHGTVSGTELTVVGRRQRLDNNAPSQPVSLVLSCELSQCTPHPIPVVPTKYAHRDRDHT